MKALTSYVLLLVCGCFCIPVRAEDPDPVKILSAVDVATRAVKNVSYKAKSWTEGDVGMEQPELETLVKTKEIQGGALPCIWMQGTLKASKSAGPQRFRLVMNEKQAIVIDDQAKDYRMGDLPEAVKLVGDVMQTCIMREFVHPTPFSDELSASLKRYEGKKMIAGVECHVIFVVYRGGSESRWYFGVKDNLPHRVDRIGRGAKGIAARVLELSDVNTGIEFDASTFAIEIPAGYREKQQIRTIPSSPGLLPVGTTAPDWTLKTPAGKKVVLSELRGKVVLLDFWATWCGPCRRVMPALQKLHEEYQEKPLLVYGINTWERGDPVRFMREEKYTYGLLLQGDNVARQYGVRGIPTLYLIGPNGEVLFAVSGYNPGQEKILKELIDGALGEIEKP